MLSLPPWLNLHKYLCSFWVFFLSQSQSCKRRMMQNIHSWQANVYPLEHNEFSCKSWAAKPELRSPSLIPLSACCVPSTVYIIMCKADQDPTLTEDEAYIFACSHPDTYTCVQYARTHMHAHTPCLYLLSCPIWQNSLANCIKSSNIKYSVWHRNSHFKKFILRKLSKRRRRKRCTCKDVYKHENL